MNVNECCKRTDIVDQQIGTIMPAGNRMMIIFYHIWCKFRCLPCQSDFKDFYCAGKQVQMLSVAKRRKIDLYGHVTRYDSLSKTRLQDTVKDSRQRG
jgi:hypothetical protein